MSSIRILFIASAAALAVAGCASTKLAEKPAPVVEESKPPAAPAPAPAPPPVAKVEAPPPQPVDLLNDPNSVLAKRSVYFDFDKSLIRAEFQPLIEAHGRYMVEHAARQIRIEGNCGVQAVRIETISFGKEKPKTLGHDEKAWAENRRADVVYR